MVQMRNFDYSGIAAAVLFAAAMLSPWLGWWPFVTVLGICLLGSYLLCDRIAQWVATRKQPAKFPTAPDETPCPPPIPLSSEERERRLVVLERVLADMTPVDAMDLLINRLRKMHSTDPLPLAIIFDTSFLMLEKWPVSWETLCSVIDEIPLKARLVVAAPVHTELRKHLEGEDGQKGQLARIARKRLAELLERGVEEPSLEGVQEAEPSSSIGADSATDRKLIGHGRELAVSGQVCGVMVATDDGGIMLDVANLYREGVPIATLTKEKKAEEILRLVRRWLATDEFLASMNMK